jgi:putative ABC transport system permease protein
LLRNYFAAALRNLWRHRLVVALNLFGMAVAFSAAIFIGLYTHYETHHDRFLPDHERLYRISGTIRAENGEYMRTDYSPANVLELLESRLPEMELGARMDLQWHSVSAEELEFNEQTYEADPEFFRLIRIPAVAGDLEHALDAPDGMAISRSLARKYFGGDSPLGETLKFERERTYRVTAVFEDLPPDSHFNFRIVTSGRDPNGHFAFATGAAATSEGFTRMAPAHNYLRLAPGTDLARVRSVLEELVSKYMPGTRGGYTLDLMAIGDIHLSLEGRAQMKPRGSWEVLNALSVVAFLILVIAVLNFVNLTTARAADRSTEVAIRKLAGARRIDLAVQFLGEALLQVSLAMLLAFSIVELLLPHFALLLEVNTELYAIPRLDFRYWSDPSTLVETILFTLGVGLIAGAWPAFVMSSFRPAAVLKGVLTSGRAGARVRSVLVSLQFALLIGLVFSASVIYRQTHFALGNAMRIDVDQVVMYNLWSDFSRPERPTPGFVQAVRELPGVRAVTSSGSAPTILSMMVLGLQHQGSATPPIQLATVDYNFFEFYGVKLLAGRTLEETRTNDRLVANGQTVLGVVINEGAVRALGYADPARALGARITAQFWPPDYPRPEAFEVVGVVRDFPSTTLREEIKPALYYVYERDLSWVSIRIDGQKVPETLESLREAWKQHGQPRAQAGWFLDTYYREKYADVLLQQRALMIFCGCAAVLGVLGLFGLSLFTVQRRTREIGIRRALGAGTGTLTAMLLWEFAKPVLWASALAWPFAYFAGKQWLTGFVYRVEIGWWWLPLTTLAALGIALLTVSAHSYAVARARPALALRHE